MGQKDGGPETEVKTKLVVVGDCGCGKTTLIKRYINSSYTDTYTATGFDTYNTTYQVSATYRIHLSIWDTSGDSGYDRVRPVSYTGADLVLACFSIGNPDSLHNIVTKWLPEIREHCPNAPIIVVGCGNDMRTNDDVIAKLTRSNLAPVTYEQGLKTAKDIDALVYSETSAKTSESSVRDVLEVAALSSVGTKQMHAGESEGQSRKSFRKKNTSSMGEAKSAIKKESKKGCAIM
ncbi:RND3-like protein [Mya arenaria]|uniref:RND3-like protein n=1 Tax=Mya arenaria TaxID=6604 RepID=A0ABY7DDJ5_MYAAR|nr:ras-like GTP-binding protein rhoA [Mya arenaria]WAQ94420.1 RND3-like protein [Mya arenaria]